MMTEWEMDGGRWMTKGWCCAGVSPHSRWAPGAAAAEWWRCCRCGRLWLTVRPSAPAGACSGWTSGRRRDRQQGAPVSWANALSLFFLMFSRSDRSSSGCLFSRNNWKFFLDLSTQQAWLSVQKGALTPVEAEPQLTLFSTWILLSSSRWSPFPGSPAPPRSPAGPAGRAAGCAPPAGSSSPPCHRDPQVNSIAYCTSCFSFLRSASH